jgi:hypothetical protein
MLIGRGAGRRTIGGVVGGIIAATAMLLSACGTSDFTYAGSTQLNVVFRVPGNWTEFTSRDLATASGNVRDQTFTAKYPFLIGFDASPDPNVQRIASASAIAEYPTVLSFVQTLAPAQRDTMSLRTLRNAWYNVDQLENDGTGQTVSYSSFSQKDGYWGNKFTFVIRPTPTGPAVQFTQLAATDVASKYEYVLLIRCSPDCFARNQGAITDVLNSWRLRG